MKKKSIVGIIVAVAVIVILSIIVVIKLNSNKPNEVVTIDDNYRTYYEIFTYSFYDSDKDGIGDLRGIVEKLDHINDGDNNTMDDLGCNGIWLMPIMPSTTYHKYDVVDYYDIDPEYGTLDDFKVLVEECDKRDIKLIIDFVFNHTSSKHKWFVDAVEYLEQLPPGIEASVDECPYVDYYNFVYGEPSKSGYYRAGDSEYYYEAMFWSEMPDLNLGSDAVRVEIENVAKFWMDMGIGGFRLDAAKEFYSGNVGKNTEVLEWFTSYVKGLDEEAYVVAEVWSQANVITQMYASGIDSMFNFPLARHDGLVAKTVNRHVPNNAALLFGRQLVKYQEDYSKQNPDYIDAPFLANHDMARLAGYYLSHSDRMKMAAGVLMTLNGSPFLYYGEEIGMKSIGKKDESKRTPFIWSNTNDEGMTSGPVAMELAEPKFAPLDEQLEDEQSIYRYYTRAIRLRNENPEIARGKMSLCEEVSGDTICVIKKNYKDEQITIVYNISDEADEVDLEAIYCGERVYSQLTVDVNEKVVLEDTTLKMPKYSIAVLR